MADISKMRKDVRAILDKYGFDNKFGIRTVGFSDLARERVQVILIKKWKPSRKASDIKREIYKRYSKVVVEFA